MQFQLSVKFNQIVYQWNSVKIRWIQFSMKESNFIRFTPFRFRSLTIRYLTEMFRWMVSYSEFRSDRHVTKSISIAFLNFTTYSRIPKNRSKILDSTEVTNFLLFANIINLIQNNSILFWRIISQNSNS